MNQGPIEYVLPTSRSFTRMKHVLFQPFDIGKWFILGFTAWLAGLTDGGGSTGGGGGGDPGFGSGGDQNAEQFLRDAGDWIQDNLGLVITVGSFILLIIVVISVVLTWISSRGKFMFLDNVVHNRALVKDPWARFRTLGNSLFLWRLVFGLIVFAVILLIIGSSVLLYFAIADGGSGWVLPVVVGGVLLLSVMIAAGYIGMLLEDFVVPVMYREFLTANDAWRRFLALHKSAVGSFVLYALWKILLGIGVGLALLLAGAATCCIGFILMAIPYIGAVVLLPVSVFFRFFGPEFLRQFGSDYDILVPVAPLPNDGPS